MSLLRRIMGAETRATLSEPPDWMWDAFGGQPTYSGKSVTQPSSLGISGVYAAVKLLSTKVGELPLIVYRGETRDRERAEDAWQWRLLKRRPNPEMTADLFYETLMGHLNLWGNFYLEKQKVTRRNGTREVSALWPINPSLVDVTRDPRTGLKRFEIRGVDGYLYADTILHGMAFGYDGLKGLSPIAAHRQMLGGVMARSEYVERFYANSAQPSGVLQVDGTLSEEAAQRLKASWEAAHRGAANSNRVAVLEEGVTWQTIGMPLNDQQYIEQKVHDVNECARIFQVPPEMIGGERGNSITYANETAQVMQLKVFSLNHWLVRIENILREDPDLFPDTQVALYPEFLAEGLLRGDSKTRSDYYVAMSGIGAITVNEIRGKENMPPVEWGDKPFPVAGAAAPADTTVPAGDTTARNGHRSAFPV